MKVLNATLQWTPEYKRGENETFIGFQIIPINQMVWSLGGAGAQVLCG
jgi:hypothetical protein